MQRRPELFPVLRVLADAAEEEAYFRGVHSQGELDLMLVKDGQRCGCEA